MKPADLKGADLDYWVAMGSRAWTEAHIDHPTMTLDPTFRGAEISEFAGGRRVCRLVPNNPFRQDYVEYSPSTNWAQGGPLIERWKIDLGWVTTGDEQWVSYPVVGMNEQRGGTALIAAMRSFVASVFGDEFEPEAVEQRKKL